MADFAGAVARQRAFQLYEAGMLDAALELGKSLLKQSRKDAELLFMLGRAARESRKCSPGRI